ncbi:MAG: L-lactate permease [Desulfitobacterium sp.]
MFVAIPIFFLFWALAIKKMKGHIAGVLTLLIAFVDVVLVYGMPVGNFVIDFSCCSSYSIYYI